MKDRRLLVVDFDYFFPVVELFNEERLSQATPRQRDTYLATKDHWPLYDWGHSETHSPSLLDHLWHIRAAGFAAAGLHFPGLIIDQIQAFWKEVRLTKHADLFYADSNANVMDDRVHRGMQSIVILDPHHDAGYNENAAEEVVSKSAVSCENWVIPFVLNGRDVELHYPSWRFYAPSIEPEPQVPLTRIVDPPRFNFGDLGVFDRVFVCRSGAWVPSWLDTYFWQFIGQSPTQRHIAIDTIMPRGWNIEFVHDLVTQFKAAKAMADSSNEKLAFELKLPEDPNAL